MRDDAHVIAAVLEIHEDDPTLGYRFIADELADAGIVASENGCGDCARQQGSSPRTPARSPGPASPAAGPRHLLGVIDAKGRVTHDFTATAPNQKWLTDITEHWNPSRRGQALPLRDQGLLLQQDRRLLHRQPDEVRAGGRGRCATRSRCAHRPARRVTPTRGGQFRSKKVMRILKNNGLHGSMGRVWRRRQRSLGKLTPVEFEMIYTTADAA